MREQQTIPTSKDLDALRLLKTLRRGEEVVVNTEGVEQVMLVSRELDVAHELVWTPWELANVQLLKDFSGEKISITAQQQINQTEKYIVSKTGIAKAVEVGPDIYQRLDELAEKYDDTKAMASAVKNMLSKRMSRMVKV